MKRAFLCLFGMMLLIGPANVWAHSQIISSPITLELGETFDIRHDDYSDWKGTLSLTVTNTGSEAWGDFHFYLLSADDSVVFDDTLSVMTGASSFSSWLTDDGHTLDFYFYDDPVYTGESLSFEVYTDNTASELSFFNVSLEASPVPAPGAFFLLGSGLIGLMGLRKKQHRR